MYHRHVTPPHNQPKKLDHKFLFLTQQSSFSCPVLNTVLTLLNWVLLLFFLEVDRTIIPKLQKLVLFSPHKCNSVKDWFLRISGQIGFGSVFTVLPFLEEYLGFWSGKYFRFGKIPLQHYSFSKHYVLYSLAFFHISKIWTFASAFPQIRNSHCV